MRIWTWIINHFFWLFSLPLIIFLALITLPVLFEGNKSNTEKLITFDIFLHLDLMLSTYTQQNANLMTDYSYAADDMVNAYLKISNRGFPVEKLKEIGAYKTPGTSFCDAWKSPIIIIPIAPRQIKFQSAGSDKIYNTNDDVYYNWPRNSAVP